LHISLYGYIVVCVERKNFSTEALEMIANRFKVLSEPMRLRILHQLQDGEKSVGELCEAVEASQPNVSKHLKILQEAGILTRRQRGNAVYYSIADEDIFDLCELVCSSLEARLKNRAEILVLK
jgi:DNA-binding transcriptional ArsR family regulator